MPFTALADDISSNMSKDFLCDVTVYKINKHVAFELYWISATDKEKAEEKFVHREVRF